MMAHAYTDPTASPATTVRNPLMPLFLATERRADEATRRAEAAERRAEESAARDRETRAYLKRGDIEPGPKLLYLQMAYELDHGPGSPAPTERPWEFKTIVNSWMTKTTGMNERAVGAWLEAAVDPEMTPVPLFRRRTHYETNPNTGMVGTVYQYAPVEGRAWAEAWGTASTMPVPITNRRREKDRLKALARREEKETVVAEARRIIAAACPHCGSTDVFLVCRACGTKTHADEIPGASAPARTPSRQGGVPDDSYTSSKDHYQLSPTLGADDSSTTPEPTTVAASGAAPAPAGAGGVPDDSYTTPQGDDGGRACLEPLTPQETLAGALRVVAPAVLPFPNHIVMTGKAHPKYLTVAQPLGGEQIAAHFLGTATYGGGLCWPDPAMKSGRAARAIAWDSDDELGRLIRGATLLRRRGLAPLIVKNPSKPNSGHLWLFFDAPVDPVDALARAEQIAPCLRAPEVRERFPNPDVKGGHRIRLPGGRYLPVGAPSVPVLVAQATVSGAPAWLDGTTPAGWAAIAGAVTHAPDLLLTWVDPAHRPKAPKPPAQVRPAAARPVVGGSDFFETFNRENPVASLVTVNRRGFFKSPWHDDASPSCKVGPDGLWCDFSRDRRGGDAFDLWCALPENGFWPDTAERPDRKAAYAFLCPPEPKKKG